MSSKSTFLNSTSKSYALALYELVQEKGNLEKVENEVKGLKKLLSECIEFKEMILSPTITIEKKIYIISLLSDQNNFSEVLKRFLGYITTKNRLFFLGKIIESFLNLVSKNKGELKAKLVSSKKLSSEEQNKIQVDLSSEFKSKLDINFKYDSDLISGLIIQVGSIMVDTSLRTKLNKLEKSMLEA